MTDATEPLKTSKLAIGGMHCPNCDILIERSLKSIPGVVTVAADHAKGCADIRHAGALDMAALQKAVEDDGYSVAPWHERSNGARGNTARDYAEIGAIFLVLAGIVLVLRQFDLLPRGLSVSDNMGYGLVFLIGLVASVSSCIAVTGGLLVALAAKYNETHAQLGAAQRLWPHLYFNAGRIVSYTLFGGAIGALGSTLTLSPEVNGALTVLASAVMIVLGLQMLGLMPAGILPRLPKSFAHRIHGLTERGTDDAAFAFGAATFFLPCGFTQALQLYVLAKGSFMTGALIMLAFSLGTLPALLSLSAVASFAKGAFQRHFLKLAGVAVIVLGVLNIQYGLVLTDSSLNAASTATEPMQNGPPPPTAGQTTAPVQVAEATPAGDKQIVVMKIDGFDYIPNRFRVKQGVPVEWRIDASEAAGCGRILIAPGLGVRRLLSAISTTTIAFTPHQAGEFAFNCGMGMMTPGSKFTVIPNAG